MIIVEDGTGKPDAESYASVEYADEYHAKRNNTAWALLTTAVKEASLIKATDYMMQQYRLRWAGSRTTAEQALDFPRAFVPRDDGQYASYENLNINNGNFYYANDVVLKEVQNACVELALRASVAELSADLEPVGNVKSESVDGAVSVAYTENNIARYKIYRMVDEMLKPFLLGSGVSFKVSRG